MLTLRQLFAVSGVNSSAGLVQKFGLQPLSVASVIKAYEQQRQICFVNLVSPRILLSGEVQSYSDLVRLYPGPLGQMNRIEVQGLSQYLEAQGLYLRYVSKDLRRAAVFGSVPSLVSVPAAPVNDGNLIALQDAYSGATKVGTGIIAGGTVIISVTVAPALPAAGETFLFIGAAAVAIGAGFLIGVGIAEIVDDLRPPALPPKQPSSENTDVPNDTGDGDTGNIEVPSAVAVGNPDNGIDVNGLLSQLATSSLDELLNNLPVGWDSDAGVGLPGIGAGDLGGDGGGGLPGGFGV